MAFRAKYSGTCKTCSGRIGKGELIQSIRSGGYQHVGCGASDDTEAREINRANQEYNLGVADYDRWKTNQSIFGHEAAEAMEIEWEMQNRDF